MQGGTDGGDTSIIVLTRDSSPDNRRDGWYSSHAIVDTNKNPVRTFDAVVTSM